MPQSANAVVPRLTDEISTLGNINDCSEETSSSEDIKMKYTVPGTLLCIALSLTFANIASANNCQQEVADQETKVAEMHRVYNTLTANKDRAKKQQLKSDIAAETEKLKSMKASCTANAAETSSYTLSGCDSSVDIKSAGFSLTADFPLDNKHHVTFEALGKPQTLISQKGSNAWRPGSNMSIEGGNNPFPSYNPGIYNMKSADGGQLNLKVVLHCPEAKATPAPAKEAACYWMSNQPGNPWLPAPQGNISKADCQNLDSCNEGGGGQSGGGCYKWATDANAPDQGWK